MARTWAETLAELKAELGRKPTLDEMLARARGHVMTPEEVEAQRQSFVRAGEPTGDPRWDTSSAP